MIHISDSERRRAFTVWLRTGRVPSVPTSDGVERKFNPWHDPSDGRFTFAGSGRHYGGGGAGLSGRANGRNTGSIGGQKLPQPRISARSNKIASTPKQAGQPSRNPPSPAAVQTQSNPTVSRRNDGPNPVTEFVVGAAEGGYEVMKGAVTGAYAALTTNPVTTLGNAGRGIAGMIDTSIAAEDTPAKVQISRAADAVASASPRDIGRATGTVAGNLVVAALPASALARASRLRGLRIATPASVPSRPPDIGWVRETLVSDKPWKIYNDTAPGARAGQAPTLMRALPDGSKRPVKFDGYKGRYPIDRKWKVVNSPKARGQLLRQAAALAQNHLIGIWEVPDAAQKIKALKLLREMKVTNIKVRVIKP